MRRKNWPYWLMGGIIGLVASVLFVIVAYINCEATTVEGFCDLAFLGGVPLTIITITIGTIIGLIVGKVKRGKK